MERQFIHNLVTSFTLWFDHTLLSKGKAFSNTSGRLYSMKDDEFAGYNVFGSPFKQWVYDSSISGANIPSGLYVNGNFKSRGTTGLALDFQNGRGIFDGGNSSWNVSGNFSVKDFNIYRTTRSDEELLFNNNYLLNPSFPQVSTGIPGDKIIAPAIFIKLSKFTNDAFSIGGLDESTANMRVVVLSDSEYSLDAVGSIFSDTRYNNFGVFPKTPLNEFGDVKSGLYNYNNYLTEYSNPSNLAYIADVDYSKLLTIGDKKLDPNLDIGFLDFDIRFVRTTQ